MRFFCRTTAFSFILVMHLISRIVESESNTDCSANTYCFPCVSSTSLCNWCGPERKCYTPLEKDGCSKRVVSEKKNGTPSLCNLFDSCDRFNTYEQCIESSKFYKCGWCVSNKSCTSEFSCSNSANPPWITNGILKNPLFAMFNATTLKYSGSENILLHSNASHLIEPLVEAGLECKITIENSKPICVKATVENKYNFVMVSCVISAESDKTLPLQHNTDTSTARLSLYTPDIPNLYSTDVIFFDCRAYSPKKKCMNNTFECRWCPDEEKCIHKTEIKDVCPNAPTSWITSFWPEKGPRQGGTNITIRGENLDKSSIKVVGRSCKPSKYEDVSSKKISCTIEQSPSFQASKGLIEIVVDEKVTKSNQTFMFVEPNITDIYPKGGFTSGGTELTIKGEHLDAGSSISVFIGDQSCTIFFYNSSIIQCITNKYCMTAEEDMLVSVVFDTHAPNFTNNSYKYINDKEHDENGFNVQPKSIPAGGIKILIRNITLEQTDKSIFNVNYKGNIHNGSCEFQGNSSMICSSPQMPINNNLINAASPMKFDFWLTTSTMPNQNISMGENQSSTFLLYPNPKFSYFSNSFVPFNKNHYVIIEGENINNACQKSDIIVKMDNYTCDVISLSLYRVICVLPKPNSSDCIDSFEQKCGVFEKYENIMIYIADNFKAPVPKKHPLSPENSEGPSSTLIIYAGCSAAVIGTTFLLLIIVCLCVNRKKSNSKLRQHLVQKQQQVDQLELRVAAECKEAFAELQTQPITIRSDDTCDSLLFLDYRSYVMKILFSTINCYPVILGGKPMLINKVKGLKRFDELIMDRKFLLIFVRTLEAQNNFSMNDRVYVASMIMMILQKDMEYATNILKTLMSELVEKYIRDKKQPKLIFRQTENIAEKMISAWFSFLLHRFLRKSAAKALHNLFKAINQQIKKGPVDMITLEARYCLSENKIIRQTINYCSLTVLVNVSKTTASIIKLPKDVEKIPVEVLDCDTITQVKEKIIDVIFHSVGYSKRPNLHALSIEWIAGPSEWIFLSDHDASSKIEGEWRQLNTLKHYGVFDRSILYLTSVSEANDGTAQMKPVLTSKNAQKNEKYVSLSPFSNNGKSSVIDPITAPIQNDTVNCKEWHLVKPRDTKDNQDNVIGDDHIIPEIYLTRLLAMKGGLQRYVDDLFEIIFSKTHQNDCFPLAIKCMFDFLDGQALRHGITDPEVVHIWKNNCLPLRFWVNLIKNPEFLFDVHKSSVVDSCLSVVAQVLMDSCSTTEQCLNKNSATSKLLYAKDIPVYRKLVGKYYADIRKMPATPQQKMSEVLAQESQLHAADFDKNSPVYELFKYAMKYQKELSAALEDDQLSQSNSLPFKFQRLINTVSGEPDLKFMRPPPHTGPFEPNGRAFKEKRNFT